MTKSKIVGGMRFKDLAMFNDSLLAKQVWRLLHNQDSLFYKVFSPMPQSWRLQIQEWDPILGRVFS